MDCRQIIDGCGLVSAIFFAIVTASAAAQGTDSPQAREVNARFDVAQAEAERGNYALAAEQFREIYRILEGHPNQFIILYNLGRCYEELGASREAADAYTGYLRRGRPRVKTPMK